MASSDSRGYFILADISGFTGYLAGVELDHANGVLRDLLELIVAHLVPPLRLAGIERDAVFVYLPAARLGRGETILEILETTYARFQVQQASITRRTTCGCKACQQIPELDLNFVIHSGEYRLARVAGRAEPLGLAADLVRSRALKPPHARAAPGYALFTAASLTDPALLGAPAEIVSAGPAGRLETYRLDLRARYQAEQTTRQAAVPAQAAQGMVICDVAAPPAVVWDWLNDPGRRSLWTAGRIWHAGDRPAGRTGPGARNHCDHGLGAAIETVLDWQPFEQFTVELVQRGGGPVVHQTYVLEPVLEGQHTRLRCLIQFQPPLPRWLGRTLGRLGGRPLLKADLQRLAGLIAEETTAELPGLDEAAVAEQGRPAGD